MVLQEIDADYIGRDKLVALLKRKFGKDYSFHLNAGHWVVDVPDYISEYEIECAQEG